MHRILEFSIACLAFATAIPAEAQEPATSRTPSDSLTLVEVLSRVRDTHPLVQAASARVDAARGSRRTAGAFINPVLQYQVEDTPLPGRGPLPIEREAMTTATIPLEPLYQRGPRVARANADVRSAEADARTEGIRVSLEAARSYYRTSIAQVTVDATRELSAWLDSVVTYNRARVKEGIAAEADLIRTQLEEDRIAAELSMQEANLAVEQATLLSFLGSPPSASPVALAVSNRPIDWRLPEMQEVGGERTSVLVERTPRVQSARERVGSATAGVGLERRMIVDNLSAIVGTKNSAGFTSMVAGVSLPLPLFAQNRGEIARATAERHVAEFELAAAQLSGTAELQGAFDAATVLSKRATALSAPSPTGPASTPAMLARADESRRIALGAYREGAVPLLSVLDAARAWSDVRITFYRALFAQHESVLVLAAALGIPPDQVLTSTTPVLRVPR